MKDNQLQKINPVSLGKRCKARRESLDMTREELAEKINLSPNFIGQFESGDKLLSMSNFYLLCQALRSSPNQLLDIPITYNIPNEELKISDNISCHDDTKAIVKKLFQLILNLSDEEKLVVNDLIDLYDRKRD